jgi:hypothetical protein
MCLRVSYKKNFEKKYFFLHPYSHSRNESDPEWNPDPLVRDADPQIRISRYGSPPKCHGSPTLIGSHGRAVKASKQFISLAHSTTWTSYPPARRGA